MMIMTVDVYDDFFFFFTRHDKSPASTPVRRSGNEIISVNVDALDVMDCS
jgi:hypothetical protein